MGHNYPRLTKSQPFFETRQQGKYTLISPLLECDSANFEQDTNLNTLKDKVADLTNELRNQKSITHASVYYRDLNNGPWFGIDEKEFFSPASLVKVPIMMAYFKLAESDPTVLTKTLEVQTTLPDNQNIEPSIRVTPNNKYTVQELINRMIIYSDNEAYELLQGNIDNQNIVQTYTDLGIDINRGFSDPSGNILSVKDYASFFRILYNASYLDKKYSQAALELLSKVEYKNGLVKGINDPKVTIAHKFGERAYTDTQEKQLHDCGIVYNPHKPFLVCIMTRGTNFDKLSSAINQISSLIYSNVTNKVRP